MFFVKHFFLYQTCNMHFQLKRILILTIKKTKALEVDEIHYLTHLINAFASNMFLTLKIYEI